MKKVKVSKKPSAKEFTELKEAYHELQGVSVQRGFGISVLKQEVKDLSLEVTQLKEDNERLNNHVLSSAKTIGDFYNGGMEDYIIIKSLKKVIARYELFVITVVALVAIHVALVAVHSG